jgi:thiosulfate/3-mercaptopyruvate sulfurtransferase
MDPLVTTEWLAGELGAQDLRVLDATYFLAEHGRAARAEFEGAHIPGAVFMDMEDLSDTSSPLPNMLPSAEKFASRMQALGVGDGNRIVVYDNSPLKSAARAWWMLNVYGAHEVAVLDGGFEKWKAEGRPIEAGKPVVRHRHFTVWKDADQIRSIAEMRQNLNTGKEQVVDARSAPRFRGEEAEHRPGVRPGHIPGSRNLPYASLFNADGTWKQGEALRQAFADAGIDPERPVVTTCGSGVTAAVLSFGLHLLGAKDTALYDGSWAEWGGAADTPVVTGPA